MHLRLLGRVVVLVLLGAAFLTPSPGIAHQATPESAMENPFTDLGLQQIDITMTDSAFEGVPSELDAGRYVVTLTNNEGQDFINGGAFLQVPSGMTMDEFMAIAAPMDSTPEAEDMGPPEWHYETIIAGGPYANPGQTAYAVIDLSEGQWVFWGEYPGAQQPPVPVTVTGEMPADVPMPEAAVTVEMSEFAFTFTGELTAGTHVVEVTNVGEQPHFMSVAPLPEETTRDDVLTLLNNEMSIAMGTPVATPADGLSFEDIRDTFATGDHSAGATAWYVITLTQGTHGAVCFIADPETGTPHAMLGMVEVFDVGD